MHDELFEKSDIVARYRVGPYVEAREGFLRQAGAGGYSRSTLKRIAWVLLIVAEAVHNHGGRISIDQLEKLNRSVRLVNGRRPSRRRPSCSGATERAGCGASALCCPRPTRFLGSLAR